MGERFTRGFYEGDDFDKRLYQVFDEFRQAPHKESRLNNLAEVLAYALGDQDFYKRYKTVKSILELVKNSAAFESDLEESRAGKGRGCPTCSAAMWSHNDCLLCYSCGHSEC